MPVHNGAVADAFDEIADLLEIEEANPYRVRAYRNAARTIRGLGTELAEMVARDEDLTALPGIGRDLAGKIHDMVASGRMLALDKLHERLPASLEELLRLPGLGPKRVKQLYSKLHIENLSQLARAARNGNLRELPGFGPAIERRLLDSMAARRSSEQRWPRAAATAVAEPLLEYLGSANGVKQAVIAGSYRRGKETVGDLDVLVTAAQGRPVVQRLVDYPEIREVVARGSTRATVVLEDGLQVDLRVVPAASFGAALHYFTGSKAHNIRVRRRGLKRGLKINEYGVFKNNHRLAGKTEEQVYRAVGLAWIPPELRESAGEIEASEQGSLPELVETGDLRGDLHVHSSDSDGRASIEDMVAGARTAGLSYLAVTDHSRHLTVAHGLDAARLRGQCARIDRLNERMRGFRILKGVEVDILEDGALDLPDSVLAELDVVIGAVHSHFGLSRRKQTERVLRAMDHPAFTMLAHPSGRLLGRRGPCDLDMERVVRHASDRGCYLELNSQPHRLDMLDVHCRMAGDAGVLVSINSDAHAPQEFHLLCLGTTQARRGWLTREQVLNSRPLRELRKLLRQGR